MTPVSCGGCGVDLGIEWPSIGAVDYVGAHHYKVESANGELLHECPDIIELAHQVVAGMEL